MAWHGMASNVGRIIGLTVSRPVIQNNSGGNLKKKETTTPYVYSQLGASAEVDLLGDVIRRQTRRRSALSQNGVHKTPCTENVRVLALLALVQNGVPCNY